MVEILQFLVLGAVQGITEWLPISSSGHLVLTSSLFGIEQSNALNVFLHLATLLVMFVFFWRDIVKLTKGFFHKAGVIERRYIYNILLTSIVTFGIAIFFEPFLPAFQSVEPVGWFLLCTSLILILTKWFKGTDDITWPVALILGVIQGFAVFPGLSRSGLMIAIALILGMGRREAFKYAFLAGIPVILGAFVWTFEDIHVSPLISIGFFTAIVFSFLALKLLETAVLNRKFHWFFVYTLVAGLLAVLL